MHFTKKGAILRTQTQLTLFTRCIFRTLICGEAIKRLAPCLSITALISAPESFPPLWSSRGESKWQSLRSVSPVPPRNKPDCHVERWPTDLPEPGRLTRRSGFREGSFCDPPHCSR